MWFDPPRGQVHSLPHCNAITHEAHSAIPVLTVGCVAQPVGLLLDASALPDLALAYYSAPAARVRQVQRKAPPLALGHQQPECAKLRPISLATLRCDYFQNSGRIGANLGGH